MKIWVDADACPNVIKNVIYKVARRRRVKVILVANQFIRIPESKLFSFIQVGNGFNEADEKIVKLLDRTDLVITADIPMASDVIGKGAVALNPRGEMYTTDNIRARLSMRDFMDTLRMGGVITGGPTPLDKKDVQNFTNALDKFLTQAEKQKDLTQSKQILQ
ncbi:MAG: YaiI/YqxD family protein [Candidatus Neomarinimicrobiota bacterium]|nr:MAG: YaiI/YqxD family protein [Candidatus Neomarinimicrobiota bacterium]